MILNSKMKRIIIVAASENNVIGNKGTIPWPTIKEDLRRFARITKLLI